ncbi:GH22114 [Drosophila grimshawi]|uniref:GH22114 n=1 Tax=Drosophila grimshawi TaxID=7222 RepID=B4J467_DROGR|nr:GH22114 [Drosophila grimshawi]
MSHSIKKPASEPNIEEAFNRHSPIAAKVKAEYNQSLMEIPVCLEPFAAILLEHENTILSKDTLIERMRSKMTHVLLNIYENFFVAHDVGNKLITLEVLKEKFEPLKSTNWNVNKLTPEERTRPVRMRLMDSSIRFIEKQLNSQEKALGIALAKSRENRERLQNIQNERVKTYALLHQQMDYYKEMSPKLMELNKLMIGKKSIE